MLRKYLLRLFVVMAAAVFVATISGDMCLAAKKSSGKLYVPAKMIKGSLVSSGRAFYSSNRPEQMLAGIRLGRPAREILARWGNPSRITVGTTQAEGAAPGTPATPAGPAYTPPAMTPYQGLPGMLQGMYGGPGGLPPLPGLGAPTPTPGAGTPGSTTGGATAALSQEEVTWTYDLPNGITLEFIITDGIITQITAGGIGPWGQSKTRTGLQLGDTYKLVLWVCGYPESQEYAGRFLRVRYVNRNRALFTLLNNKVVGITIALVEQDMQQ